MAFHAGLDADAGFFAELIHVRSTVGGSNGNARTRYGFRANSVREFP
jgi:hypothetical protein